MDVIRTYVKGAFAGVAQTPEALEQQQELIANMEEKARDLVAEGKSEQEALGITIAEAGDLTMLAAEFPSLESMASAPRMVEIRFALRTLLVRVGGVFAGLLGLLLMTAFVSAAHEFRGTMFLFVVAAAGVAVWRLWTALREYRAEPDTTAEVALGDRKPLRNTILRWVAVCFAAGVVNVAMGSGVGIWVVLFWAASIAMPAQAILELVLTNQGVVAVEPEPRSASAERDSRVPTAAGAASAA